MVIPQLRIFLPQVVFYRIFLADCSGMGSESQSNGAFVKKKKQRGVEAGAGITEKQCAGSFRIWPGPETSAWAEHIMALHTQEQE